MNLRGGASIVVGLAVSAFCLAGPKTRFPLSAPSEMKEIVPGQILVRFNQSQAKALGTNPMFQMAAADGRLGNARFVRQIGSSAWTLWFIDPKVDPRKMVRSLQGASGVSYAQPVNRVYPLLLPPNDGDYGRLEDDMNLFLFGDPGQYYRLWHLQDTFFLDQFGSLSGAFSNYPNTWYTATSRLRKSKVIGFVDTGADLGHPDFANAGNPSTDFANGGMIDLPRSHFWKFGAIDNSLTADDAHGHGTHVMGLAMAAGNNGSFAGHGAIGTSYQAVGVMQRVFDNQGLATDTDGAMAIMYLADQGCDVINLSIGTENYSQIFQDAVTYAVQKGSVVIAAANEDGNGGGDLGPIYPAACSGALGVTANGPDQFPATATYAGSGYYVDIAAPGGDVVQIGDFSDPENLLIYIQFVWSTAMRTPGTAHNNPLLFPPYELNYAYLAGTSMATPIVSGAAGLFMEKYRLTQSTPWANLRTYRALERSAIGAGAPFGGWESVQGFGSLDAEALLFDTNARGAQIGGCEGIVYLQEIATANIQVRAQRLTNGVPGGPIFSTTSKLDGTYRFDGMPEGEYDVWTQGGGVPQKHKRVRIYNGSDQPGVDFWIGSVFFDNTPPTGFCQLQSPGLSTTTLLITNFANDTETGIDRITFSIGTTTTNADIVPETDWIVGDSSHTINGLNLDPNAIYFVRYKMWNGAGMTTEKKFKYRING